MTGGTRTISSDTRGPISFSRVRGLGAAAALMLLACGTDEPIRVELADALDDAGTPGSGGSQGLGGNGVGGSAATGAPGGSNPAAAGSSGASTTTTGGAGGDEPSYPLSVICGDSVRGAADEECDDGPGEDADLCTSLCQVSDALAVPIPEAQLGKDRYLGAGRHPAAGWNEGFAVAYVQTEDDVPTVGLSLFGARGNRLAQLAMSRGARPVLFANPVLAALGDGQYVVAWTDGDGDELGVAQYRSSMTLGELIEQGFIREVDR